MFLPFKWLSSLHFGNTWFPLKHVKYKISHWSILTANCLCSHCNLVEFSLFSFVGFWCHTMHGMMWLIVQESQPGIYKRIIWIIVVSWVIHSCLIMSNTFPLAGMYLQQCHLLQRHSFFFMWEWMLLTLKSGRWLN